MDSKERENRAQQNCGEIDRELLGKCNLNLDNEKYFTSSDDNVGGKRCFHSTDPAIAPKQIKFQKKK
jgi:hypothetical protein